MRIEIEVEPFRMVRPSSNGEQVTDVFLNVDGSEALWLPYTRIRDARRGAKRLKKRLIEAAKKAEIVEVG